MADLRNGVPRFGSMMLIVGGVALAGLLIWGWATGQALPLWPALLVVAVNLVGAWRLLQQARTRKAAAAATAQRQQA